MSIWPNKQDSNCAWRSNRLSGKIMTHLLSDLTRAARPPAPGRPTPRSGVIGPSVGTLVVVAAYRSGVGRRVGGPRPEVPAAHVAHLPLNHPLKGPDRHRVPIRPRRPQLPPHRWLPGRVRLP